MRATLVSAVLLVLFFIHGQLFGAYDERGLTINHYPQRIVSLGPIHTENIYLLNAQDRLVGNTQYCVRPEAARNKEHVGSVMHVSIEKIINLRPDLILATRFTKAEQVKQLRNLGIKVVRFQQSTSFADSCDQFLQLGRLLGMADRAEQIVEQVKKEVEAVQKKVAHLPRQKVFLQLGVRPLKGSVNNLFTNDFIVLGGGINILAGQESNKTNYEKVIAANPDVIIIAIMGSESSIAAQEKKKWQRFGIINGVRDNRVHVIDPDLICSPSPATFAQTFQTIAGLIHPEMVNKEDK